MILSTKINFREILYIYLDLNLNYSHTQNGLGEFILVTHWILQQLSCMIADTYRTTDTHALFVTTYTKASN